MTFTCFAANDQRCLKELTLGKRVGFYRIRGDLGSGNFSQVKIAVNSLTRGEWGSRCRCRWPINFARHHIQPSDCSWIAENKEKGNFRISTIVVPSVHMPVASKPISPTSGYLLLAFHGSNSVWSEPGAHHGKGLVRIGFSVCTSL